ncbi:hypothetical protein FPQ18DRAFT_352255 [Pyronema domesticum]|uniref:Late endosomal/lysosomal adaptor and MAPK and MTOR activator 5 n=1 Tax=Pyronema omphalodes (strain CBS 100304) TaxID=1076935 RepID=U4KZ76_PYROM|nr:hypothetical protein FPQ18DRAFT_352255 [Pyronema domesticum]CCX07356.1 Similar to hypothetical protein [Tuber melanosporum Mel28]; acc. no. XP_002841065 [Pyronema omphalodes CBS 100304]
MDPSAITRFLDGVMASPSVSGAILINAQDGLCLGATGKAREDDAPQLLVASRKACDQDGVGCVQIRGGKVSLQLGEKVLVGVFKDV